MADDAKPGLQIERTFLSWQRTSFGFLAVSAVLLFHIGADRLGPGRTALAVLSTGCALAVLGIARSRGRLTVDDAAAARPTIRPPALAVPTIGWATTVLATLILIMALSPGW